MGIGQVVQPLVRCDQAGVEDGASEPVEREVAQPAPSGRGPASCRTTARTNPPLRARRAVRPAAGRRPPRRGSARDACRESETPAIGGPAPSSRAPYRPRRRDPAIGRHSGTTRRPRRVARRTGLRDRRSCRCRSTRARRCSPCRGARTRSASAPRTPGPRRSPGAPRCTSRRRRRRRAG